ncbi:hypothetical protein CVT25_001477 [Psilocybe cyanescens]|uniref:G domain-containing protein n=1 Tax=Psilocybe cyanescens TaxID=93625 RepID=A0A409WNM9_PSICY|nr:hypothetical protein CVT25_001477 [Psilocybe cyanescens]
MASESTIDDIIKTVERSISYPISCVCQSGVGKSSLINCIFGITEAHVAHNKPGESDIEQEFTSQENKFFVLHDSKGFEPGDVANFKTVHDFIERRSRWELPLKDRIHGVWLCTETPTAGGRIFEAGDERLLKLAHKNQIPIVIVFTQYDRLVRTKRDELEEEEEDLDQSTLDTRSKDEAQRSFEVCVESLHRTMDRLKIPMPHHVKVSGYQEDVSELVTVTRDIVKEQIKGDAWIMWAIAQRASLPLKIEACITGYVVCDSDVSVVADLNSVLDYRRVLTGTVPGFGQMLLRSCLIEVHKDIITCWNFKGEVLNTDEFKQLMLHLIQDVHTKPNVSTAPKFDIISQFVGLVTASSAPIAPPVAILGLTYAFLDWLSNAILENIPDVQRLLIAYTVDLISVLRELFDLTLKPALALTATWEELQEAFETYERSASRQRVHNSIREKVQEGKQILTADGLDRVVRVLVEE